jgi:hypothetical protein
MRNLRKKKVLKLVLASLLACSSVSAQANNLILNAFVFAAPVAATITFLQCSGSNADATIYTFATQNTGTASASRVTYVGISGLDGQNSFGVASVTIGGDAAGEITDPNPASPITAAIYSMANPAGTSEDVVVTFSEAIAGAAICLWQGNNSATAATDSVSVFDTNSGAIAGLNNDVPADGIAIGQCSINQNGATHSWTAGLTERADASITTDALAYSAADFDNDSVADVPLTIGMTGSGASDAECTIASFAHS